MATTIGKLLVSETLPEELKNIDSPLTKDELNRVLKHVADNYPDKYQEISKKLMQLGAVASYEEGITLNLSDTLPPADDKRKFWFDHITKQRAKILKAKGTPQEKEKALTDLYQMVHSQLVNDTYDSALKKNNPFALQVKSKARGNKMQLTQLLTTPGLYSDSTGKPIPIFITRSYAEGLRPNEFWASTYGARAGVVSTKFATMDAGALGKQLAVAATDVVVTGDDCNTISGIPITTDDTDMVGSILARDTSEFKAGTPITRTVLSKLKSKGVDDIIVRSPMTCNMDKGVCKVCTGIRETGKLPNIGDYVGITAANAIAERIAQGGLNVKHTAGQKERKDTDDNYMGFDLIEQFAQIPENFKHKAILADIDGKVDKIEEAAQGGYNVFIDNQLHYVPDGLSLMIKPGDTVESGDQLSHGILNPSEVVRYKGLGEGRKYFTDRFTQLLRNSGYDVNKRNVALLARANINHVRVGMDADSSALPDDVVTYSSFAYNYKPRATSVNQPLDKASGQYLEQPALHYTIGSKVNKSMLNNLKKYGISSLMVNKDPIDAEPFMPSLRSLPSHNPDWVAQLGASYLKANLLKQVHEGGISDTAGLHPTPGIAKGVDFAYKGK